jgi:adenosylcobinamide-phosphate synthase
MNALALLAALLLDGRLGEPDWLWSRLPHPAVLMGRLVGALDARLNRGGARRARGILCVAVLLVVALSVGGLIAELGPLGEGIAAAILLAQRSLVDHVAAVARGLRNSLAEGRASVAMIVSRDTAQMDASQVARGAIESAAENLSDGVVAPALWFLLAGAPGILVYKIINTADSMIGYRTPRHEAFGWAAARLDDLLNLVPARLTALLIAFVGGVRDAPGVAADARLHRSPNAGWPEAAMARALGVALAGPRAYHGEMRDFPWVNASGRRALTPADIDETVTMLWKAWGGLLALVAVIALVTV